MVSRVYPWCPSCGDEFQFHLRRCPDCRLDLVLDRERPEVVPEVAPLAAVPRSHRLAEFDLDGWDRGQRAQLELLARAEEVPFSWRSHTFVVNEDRAEDAARLIEEVPAPMVAQGGFRSPGATDLWVTAAITKSWRPHPPAALDLPRVGSPWRRLSAALLDGLIMVVVIALITASLRRVGVVLDGRTAATVSALYGFVAVSGRGRTIGKALLGLRVEALHGGRAGWVRAALRAIVGPTVTALVALLSNLDVAPVPLALGLFALQVALYGGILIDPLRRTVADRVAGTVVLRPRFG